jgi:hypothetical protein
MKKLSAAFHALLFALAACGPAPLGNQAERAAQRSYMPMNGYRNLKLGMSFEDVIAKLDADLFNPASLKGCFDELALRGCRLSRRSDDTIYEMRSGIPYAVGLNFNSEDKITDIELNYHHEGKITGDECRGVFARTVDWAVKDYGALTYERAGDSPDVEAAATSLHAKTPGGVTYVYNKPNEDGSFVLSFMHPTNEKIVHKTEHGKKVVNVDQQSVLLFASYIVVEHGICDVYFEIREPDSVARPAFLSD